MSYPVMSTSVPWSLVKGGFRKSPHFSSLPQKTAAGRGYSTLAMMPYPTWDFELDLNAVLGGENIAGSVLQSFLGCYMAACGGGGFFLFTDPNDNVVGSSFSLFLMEDGTDHILLENGTDVFTLEAGSSGNGGVMLNVTPGAASPMSLAGDGVSTQFQLARVIGQGVDILQNVTITQVAINGTPTTAYSVSSTGVVTFTSAPPNGATITWTGSFQYLCRFMEDVLQDLARVNMNNSGFLWDCASIKFESVFL